MQYCHLASIKHDKTFLLSKHLTSAQAQISFTRALGTAGYNQDPEMAWTSEGCLLP